MSIVKEQNLYKHKENNQVVYFNERKGNVIQLLTIKTTNFDINRTFEYIEEMDFTNQYEQLEEHSAYTACIAYFEKVLFLKKMQDALKEQQEHITSFLNETKNTLSKFEVGEYGSNRQRFFHFQNQTVHRKVDLASLLSISTGTLDVYLNKLGLDHYHLSEKDTEMILNFMNELKSKEKIYTYGNIKDKDVERFLYRLNIPYPVYKKWKDETNHTLDDLTTEEGVEKLITFHKKDKISK